MAFFFSSCTSALRKRRIPFSLARAQESLARCATAFFTSSGAVYLSVFSSSRASLLRGCRARASISRAVAAAAASSSCGKVGLSRGASERYFRVCVCVRVCRSTRRVARGNCACVPHVCVCINRFIDALLNIARYVCGLLRANFERPTRREFPINAIPCLECRPTTG